MNTVLEVMQSAEASFWCIEALRRGWVAQQELCKRLHTLGPHLRAFSPGSYLGDLRLLRDTDADPEIRNVAAERLGDRMARGWRLWDPELRDTLRKLADSEGKTEDHVKRQAMMAGISQALSGHETPPTFGAGETAPSIRPIDLPVHRYDQWLQTTAIGHARASLRDDYYPKRRAAGDLLLTAQSLATREQEDPKDPASDALEALIMEESLANARESHAEDVERLYTVASPRERELLELLQAQPDLSDVEAAEWMGVKPATIRQWKFRLSKKAGGM